MRHLGKSKVTRLNAKAGVVYPLIRLTTARPKLLIPAYLALYGVSALHERISGARIYNDDRL